MKMRNFEMKWTFGGIKPPFLERFIYFFIAFIKHWAFVFFFM
jgi:hypothetical protein